MIDLLAVATEMTTAVHIAPQQVNYSVWILPLLMLLVYVFIIGLIIVGLIRLIKYLGSAKKEQKLMRMELGKLAEEVHLIRKEIKGKNPGESDS